jgi:hypothetical protein
MPCEQIVLPIEVWRMLETANHIRLEVPLPGLLRLCGDPVRGSDNIKCTLSNGILLLRVFAYEGDGKELRLELPLRSLPVHTDWHLARAEQSRAVVVLLKTHNKRTTKSKASMRLHSSSPDMAQQLV